MENSICCNIMQNISKVIVGKTETIELLLVAILAEGHVLLEDMPGTGKTLMAKSLARSIGGSFKRVQFTPDLLPADITGFNIFDQQTNSFKFQKGPIMSNVLLADEINRTIPRTQSSLLEGMGENQVTVDGITMPLPKPFLVIATQNPIELEGTFPLPEAQLDRFLLQVNLGYPSKGEEMLILERFQTIDPLEKLETVTCPEEIITLQQNRKNVFVSKPVKEYILNIVEATRSSKFLKFGVSPRGSLALLKAAQSLALIEGRNYVLPDDVKKLVSPVLSHRIQLTDTETMKGFKKAEILNDIISKIAVPIDKIADNN